MSGNKLFPFLFVLIIACCPTFSVAQKSKAQLQEEKKENLRKIEEAKKILSQTTTKRRNTIGELNALNQQIQAQENLISSMRSELLLINEDIDETNLIISILEEDLRKLKEEYSAMVYAAYKASQGYNKLTFIFSASSFNEFLMRLQYMDQYGKARKKQADQIEKVQNTLKDQLTVVESKRSEKNILLAEQLRERESLNKLKNSQTQLLTNLRSKESEIKSDLAKREKVLAQIEKLIDNIIKEELAKAAAANSAASSLNLSNQFADNKTRLPWPVSGFISQKYGKHPHPVLKRIVVNNNGINIQTKSSEKVKAVFNGEVSLVHFINTVGYAVLVRHGEYFTVYAGLKNVSVEQGQQVTTNQELGEILTDTNGVSELKFELRKSTAALNPEQWLRRN